MVLNFGDGIKEININRMGANSLNDGNWHQLDIYFDANIVRLMVDGCIRDYHPYNISNHAYTEMGKKCQNYSLINTFHRQLNVNGPLQLGNIYQMVNGGNGDILNWLQSQIGGFASNVANDRLWTSQKRLLNGFNGCIRNVIFNNHHFDLINVHYSKNTLPGCKSSKLPDHGYLVLF